ncbi:hypothetical protein [Desulfoferula mesophila]|uniref:hypothetical protein n=1 Tax=Desulfoferula mesophila TaxID=3058419 RepID=UPI003D9C7462
MGMRFWRFFSAGLSGDNATTGLMGLAVLKGEFPYFFFGQNWMGGLDALLAAPLYALFGPSALTVNVLSPLISLAIMACLQPLLRKTLGVWGMLAGLAYLAVPPTTWLFWSGEAQAHYPLGLLLSCLVFLMTHRLGQAPRYTWGSLVLWGLFAGCAIWTNFSSMVVILPCVAFLLATGKGKLRLWSVPLAALAGVAGGFPLIWFNITHGMVHANQGGVFGARYVWPNVRALADNALPIVLGVNTPQVGGPPHYGVAFALLYGGLLLAMAAGAYLLFRYGRGRWFAALLAAILALNLAVVLGSAYGKTLYSPDQRYMLSLYLVLPFLVGAGARWLAGKRAWLAVAFMLVLALAHVSQYAHFQRWGSRLLDIQQGFYFSREAKMKRQLDQISAAGFRYLYSNQDCYRLDFLGNGDPVVSDYWRNRWLTSALEVDASLDPGLLNLPPGSLQLLGLRYRLWQGRVAHAFSEPRGAESLLPREGWSARTRGKELGGALNDADLTTGYSTPDKAKEGDSLTLDLGSEQTVGGLALVPAEFREVPRGLKVELAGADGKFATVREARGYWGPLYLSGPHPVLKARDIRVESYFPPQKARYLRLTHLGNSNHPWSVQEVLLFGPGKRVGASWEDSAQQVFETVQRYGIGEVYGDAWIAAKILRRFGGRIKTVSGNAAINNFGTTVPPLSQPVVLRPGSGKAVIVEQRTAGMVGRQLASRGIAHERRPAGRFAVFLLKGQALGAPVPGQSRMSAQDNCLLWQAKEDHAANLGWLEIQNPRFDRAPTPGIEIRAKNSTGAWTPVEAVKAAPVAFSGQVLLGYTGEKTLYRFAAPLQTDSLRVCPSPGQASNNLEGLQVGLRQP